MRLDITIGSGQIGSSTVLKGNRELGSGGSMLSLNLGPGANLKGTDVVVASLVQDVLTQTNRVSIEYVLSGGVKKESFVAKTVVDNDLDLCRFTTRSVSWSLHDAHPLAVCAGVSCPPRWQRHKDCRRSTTSKLRLAGAAVSWGRRRPRSSGRTIRRR